MNKLYTIPYVFLLLVLSSFVSATDYEVVISQLEHDGYENIGYAGASQYIEAAQGFNVSTAICTDLISLKFGGKAGNPPTGFFMIETDDGAGKPSGTLAHANANVTVDLNTLDTTTWNNISYASIWCLNPDTTYYINYENKDSPSAGNLIEWYYETGSNLYKGGHGLSRWEHVFTIQAGRDHAFIIYKILAPPAETATPIIVAPSPADNANNNTNVTLNVTHATGQNDVRYYLYFGDSTPTTESDLYLFNVTRTGDEFRTFLTNVSDGTYYWKWKVQNITDGIFSSNTTERTLIIDTVTPTITRLTNNNWKTDNTTIISSYLNNLTINISFFDINLEGGQTLINITNESGASAYQNLNISITGTTVNVSEIINIGNWGVGNYTIKLVATDSHTAESIFPYDVKKGLDYLRYKTEEGNTIKIKSDTFPLSSRTTKLTDRYTFEFNYLFQKDTYKFIIESYNKINYLKDSGYPAHFVIMGTNGGNWLDFGGINKKDITVKKIDDYIYEVEITSNGIKNFKFNSLGGLNKAEEHYKFRIGAVLDVWVYDEENYPIQINATATIGVQSNDSIINTSGARLINITKDITSLTLTSSGFGTEIKTISVTNKYHNLSFNMTPVSATKLYFYDEKSGALIEEESFSVYLETIGFSRIYSSITDNPHSITGLPNGLYKLKASSTNYPERQYLNLNVSNITTTNLNIYLINNTLSAEKTFYVRGSSINALEDVYINFTRIINGTTTTIAEENTDYDGAATLYLDENYEYIIIFSKSGYDTKTISLEPIKDEYIVTLILSIAKYNVSVYEGLRYSFSPSNTVLNNNTKYNFTFTLNSSIWTVTNCTLQLKNGSTVLNHTSSNTANSCFMRIEYFIGDMDNITSEARYELESLYNFTVTQQYRIIYTYEGEFSLKNFLDDLSDFSMAGFDSFGRMMLAFIVIFVILILAGKEIGFENKEILIIMFIALVGFFSFINWFYLDWDGMPEILGLKKYFIFYLMILIGIGYLFNKMRK